MLRLRPLVLALALLVAPTGCGMFGEPKPDIENAQQYSDHGLGFRYPGNWETEVAQEQVDGGITVTTITASSKLGNAMVMVQQFQPSFPIDYEVAVTEFVKGVQEATPGWASARQLDAGNWPTIHRQIFGAEREGRKVRYAVEVVSESVDHTVEIYFAELDDRLVLVYTQIPDEDRDKALPGFDLIMDSLAVQ